MMPPLCRPCAPAARHRDSHRSPCRRCRAVLAVVVASGLDVWVYVLGATWFGWSISLVRSFAEHRFVDGGTQSAVVRAGPVMSLLFLNNNLHLSHHADLACPGTSCLRCTSGSKRTRRRHRRRSVHELPRCRPPVRRAAVRRPACAPRVDGARRLNPGRRSRRRSTRLRAWSTSPPLSSRPRSATSSSHPPTSVPST